RKKGLFRCRHLSYSCAPSGDGAGYVGGAITASRTRRRGRTMAKAAAKAGAKKASNKLTKAGLITALADTLGEASSRKAVKATLEALNDIATKELKKNKVFVLPGFAKFVIATRAARPAGERINPFTGQKQMFPAKPATKVVRARPVKALKDSIAS